MNLRPGQIAAIVTLVLVAAGVGFYLWPTKRSATPPAPPPAAAKAPVQAAKPASTNDLAGQTLVPIDRKYVQDRWAGWLADTARDPFRMAQIAATRVSQPMSSARHLKLSATWLQTGSRLAVIDKRLLGVGEQINGFTVLRIEAGEVTVQGPENTEVINFTSYLPPPPPGSTRSLTNLIEELLGPERESLHN